MRWLERLRATWKKLLSEGSSPAALALSAGMGVFVAVSPFWGLQMLIVVGLAYALRLNKLMALFTVQISIPPIYAFFVVASLEIGNLLLNGEWMGIESDELPETASEAWTMLAELWAVWLTGSVIVGFVLGGLTAGLIYVLALKSPREEAEIAEREYKESQRLLAQSGGD